MSLLLPLENCLLSVDYDILYVAYNMIISVESELLLYEHAFPSFSSLLKTQVCTFIENSRKSKKISSSTDCSTKKVRKKYRYASLNDGDTF